MDKILQEYPFRCTFSLKLLIDFWNHTVASTNGDRAAILRTLQERVANAPELLGPVEDLSVLEPHRDLIRNLMSVVFPIFGLKFKDLFL